jgi:hypothetical protein
MRVSKLASKVVAEAAQHQKPAKEGQDLDLDMNSILKLHKQNIKFVQKNLSDIRTQISTKLSDADEQF